LLFSSAAWAESPALLAQKARPSPEDVVRRLYDIHLKHYKEEKGKGYPETVAQAASCFTPGFLGIIERAEKRPPNGPNHIDIDFLVNSQSGWGGFEVGKATVTGKDAVVPLEIWGGFRSTKHKDPETLRRAKVYLTDVGDGDGFQIRDIEFVAAPFTNYEGKVLTQPAFWVRKYLTEIADAKP
jgi:hypothetical protein